MLDPVTLIANQVFPDPSSPRRREAAEWIWARAQENPHGYCDIYDMLREAAEEDDPERQQS